MAPTIDRRRLRPLGLVAFACVAAHGVAQGLDGRPHELLWTCHVAALIVAFGLTLGSARVNGVGVLLLLGLGVPLWLLDLATGGTLTPTSFASHVGGLTLGLVGVRALDLPRGTWRWSIATLAGIVALSRLVTPPAANVNLAFAIHPGWEPLFPSHGAYLRVLGLTAAASVWALELVLRRLVAPAPAAADVRP
ncbi:MAG: hypothetical protein R3B09_04925 [Nannocystaceae bacterium]